VSGVKRSEEYLKRAEDAERLAQKGFGVYREDMKNIARQWRHLARQTGELPQDDPRLRDPSD
jgi:hypothetical protein